MNAIELADAVEPLVLTSFYETHYIGRKAADMLRRQHEAIKQLREALENARIEYDHHGNPMEDCDRMVMAALKDTEDLA